MNGNPIYTHLWNGSIVKTDPRIHLMGEIDEVIGYLSVAKATNGRKDVDELLCKLQPELMGLAGIVACDDKVPPKVSSNFIDEQLPIWKEKNDVSGFVIFGSNLPSSFLNLARVVARRAERTSVAMHQNGTLGLDIVSYLNKLSTLLFHVAVVETK